MNPALLILIYVFVFLVVLIVATASDDADHPADKQRAMGDSMPSRHCAASECSAEIEPIDTSFGDAGSRVGDHIITSQSDLPDFDSLSDPWDDSWGHDD